MEGALDAQSLISLSLRKIHSSRSQRGGIKLHKNLLVSYVLRNARQLYLSQRYAELCRRQQQQHPQLHYQPFPGAPTAGPDFHIPDDEGDASDDYPPPPPPHPHHQLRSCSLLGRSSEAMEDLPAPSGMRGEALAPFYPHRPLPPGSPLPPPYDFSSLHAQPPPLPSGHGSPTPAFLPPPPLPPCPSRTTVLDLDTHVVTTVDNGYLHQDCGCAQCPPVGAGTHPAAPPLPPPSPLSLLQTKRRYVQDVSIPPNGPERGAVEVVLGAPFPFKRKYDDPDSTGDPPRDHPTPPSRDPCPKRARLEDFSEPSSSSSNISNLISIFGSGFTGLVGRQQQQQQQQVLLQQQLPSPSAQQVWHQQVPQASSCSTATAAAAAAQPIDPEQQQQQQQQQHLNGQLCSKQALASLGAWTRAIVAF